MKDQSTTPGDTFLDFLIAAMKDAVVEGKNTQLKAVIAHPHTNRLAKCRIIVVPEDIKYNWPTHAPAGTPTKVN